MPLPDRIIDRLICPDCSNPLQKKQGEWACVAGHVFLEINGVPVIRNAAGDLHMPEKPEREIDMENALQLRNAGGVIGALKRLIGTNYEPYRPEPQQFIPTGASVLNAGSGFTPRLTSDTVNLDYYPLVHVDLVADLKRIPFQNNTFDLVISEFVLEHVSCPSKVCSEMLRVLRPGGVLYISYPFIHPYHKFPDDYFRFTFSGIQTLLKGTVLIEHRVLTGPASRWVGSTADLICMLFLGNHQGTWKFILRACILALLFPVKYLDLVLNRLDVASHHAVTLLGVFRKL